MYPLRKSMLDLMATVSVFKKINFQEKTALDFEKNNNNGVFFTKDAGLHRVHCTKNEVSH